MAARRCTVSDLPPDARLEKARWDFEGGAGIVGVDAFIGDARAATERFQ